MAPTIQAQHVVAVTIPTIAVIFFTYLWYKKRSNSVTRGRSDPGGGGGTSKKRNRHRTTGASAAAATNGGSGTASPVSATTVAIATIAEKDISPLASLSEEMRTAMQKAIRDLETAAPIQEVCSDVEETYAEQETTTVASQTVPSTRVGIEDARTEGEENNNVVESAQAAEGSSAPSSDVDASTTTEPLSWAQMSEADAEELPVVQKQTKCELSSTPAQTSAEDVEMAKTTPSSPEGVAQPASSTSHCVDAATTTSSEDDKSCEYKVRSATSGATMTSVATQSGGGGVGQCCGVQRPPKASDKNHTISRTHAKDKSVINEDLDVAMQKLESMRISGSPGAGADKTPPKRKSTSAAKRQDAAGASSADEKSNAGSGGGAKSPGGSAGSGALSPVPSCHLSKAQKRKSRKKAKPTNGNNSDESTTCKALTNEGSDGDARNTCDSIKNYDVCADRTADKNNAKCAYSSSRARVPENERMYINSHDDDSLRCSIKKSDDCDRKVVENHQQEDCDNERDSANHSPVDNILDSQSVHFSDAHSEGSSDSGKGCSEGAMSPSPQTPAGGSSISGDQNMVLLFQFVIPQEHVGKLIGRHGQFINSIKTDSNTKIYIKKHPTSYKKKICALEGTQQEINKALELIRNRFPEEAYPDVTLEEFPISLPIACPLRPELFQLDLVEGVNNDVVISSVVTAGHLFLQQPMHPSYQSLTLLNISMNQVYNSPEAPVVLKPAKDNIVAAPAMDGWYRAQIVSVNDTTDMCEVRFLDYGGYLTLSTTCLRAVRADFLTLPFQAVECFLANVTPINGTWCEDAKLIVQGLTYGQILQAQVYDYTPEGIPLILLYAVHGSQVILINQELVARGYAYPTLPTTTTEGATAQSDDFYVYP